jgi:hypothetical protein
MVELNDCNTFSNNLCLMSRINQKLRGAASLKRRASHQITFKIRTREDRLKEMMMTCMIFATLWTNYWLAMTFWQLGPLGCQCWLNVIQWSLSTPPLSHITAHSWTKVSGFWLLLWLITVFWFSRTATLPKKQADYKFKKICVTTVCFANIVQQRLSGEFFLYLFNCSHSL